MPKPLNIIVTEILNEAQVSTSDTTAQTKIKQVVRREYKSLWHKYLWRDLIVIDREISVATGVDSVLIDKDIGTIIGLSEDTNDELLMGVSPTIFQLDHLLARGSTAHPWKWTPAGVVGVGTNLSANGTVKVVSDNAADTFAVRVYGKDTNGNYINETLTLNGITDVSGTSTFASGSITGFTKTQLASGTITLKDSSDTTLEQIAPREYASQYQRIKFVHTTDQAYTLYLTGKLRFQDMEYDQDVPKFDCEDLLIYAGIASVWRDRGEMGRAEHYINDAMKALKDLQSEKYVQDEVTEDSQPVIYIDPDNKPFLAGLG